MTRILRLLNFRPAGSLVLLNWPLLGLLAGCAASGPAAPRATGGTASGGRNPAIEDLGRYRPVFAAPTLPAPTASKPTAPAPNKASAPAPTNQVNAALDQRLRDQAYVNQNIRYVNGFRILACLSLEREQVMRVRREIISRYPDETDYITFKQPTYRLYVGDYPTRLDAVRALVRLRPLAPRAELEAMSVLINKTP